MPEAEGNHPEPVEGEIITHDEERLEKLEEVAAAANRARTWVAANGTVCMSRSH